jgi:hypothetical protein
MGRIVAQLATICNRKDAQLATNFLIAIILVTSALGRAGDGKWLMMFGKCRRAAGLRTFRARGTGHKLVGIIRFGCALVLLRSDLARGL